MSRPLTPQQEAWLRDPRHPIHNGLRLDPLPNLIATRQAHPDPGSHRRMSLWMLKTVMWPHLSGLQRFLIWSALAALVLIVVAGPFLIGPIGCEIEDGRRVCAPE
ncbi:hypothetical protein [Glycomyces sp. NPDC048151]|uniref:hypothetical protein n=1 Tax=Glycomyces sp. NPDC048151 TaxID=3364002 RepID=UPI00371A33AF